VLTGNPGTILALLVLPGLIYVGNPAFALLVGMALSLTFDRVLIPAGGLWGRYFLQSAIVLLGLKLNMADMWEINTRYMLLVAVYVTSSVTLGMLIGRALGVERVSGTLMASGTGICGGTTIATLAPILNARPEHVGVTLAIVFLLNALALVGFPSLGHYLELSQQQFGVWAALAIHDTSSVVATAALYGEEAAEVATTVKLGRTLWLIPLVIGISLIQGRGDVKVRIPGFILLFILASIAGSTLSLSPAIPALAASVSKALLVAALFLVGTEIRPHTLRRLRGRVLWQALALWAVVVPSTLLAVQQLVP
jgi:uncharacterized integral membrane protein (TIGR00698 family)